MTLCWQCDHFFRMFNKQNFFIIQGVVKELCCGQSISLSFWLRKVTILYDLEGKMFTNKITQKDFLRN